MGCRSLYLLPSDSQSLRLVYKTSYLQQKSEQGWLSLDPLAEKFVNLNGYHYTANNPIVFVDKDGRDIYIITNNKEIIRGSEILQRTTLGKAIWDKYANSKTDDIYISVQEFKNSSNGAATFAYANEIEGMIDDNSKVRFSQWGALQGFEYLKDWSSFEGLDVSKSKGKNIHLLNFDSESIEKESTYRKGDKVEKYNGAADKLFHEISAHIEHYTDGDQDKEHEKFGLVKKTKEIDGKDVTYFSVRKDSDAWKMIKQLIQVDKNETDE